MSLGFADSSMKDLLFSFVVHINHIITMLLSTIQLLITTLQGRHHGERKIMTTP